MTDADESLTPNYPIQSVARALNLLQRFLQQPTLSVSEASDYLGVSRSTAHRSLAMLLQHGFVRQDPRTKLYEVGPALLQIGLAAVSHLDIRTAAHPHLQRLVQLTSETAHLVMLTGPNVLFLDGVESPRAVRSGSRVGVMAPAHTTAAGKAILASLSDARLEQLYPEAELETLNSRSLATFDKLRKELTLVRDRGYATNDEESEEGVRAVASSVSDGTLVIREDVSLTVAGPRERMNKKVMAEIGPIVRDEAERFRKAIHQQA